MISLRTYKGDADLYVSTTNRYPNMTNYEYSSSQGGDILEDVVLNKTDTFSLNRAIYISIYAYTLTAYQMNI